ncbi:MAG TPA: hypothetical protein VHZ95_20685, partial [Polyangiales bacterium]|nr:hypothetical protein [Polyangiales bacterium]
ALRARMGLGVVLQVEADGQAATHNVAEQFARKLLQTLPTAAKSAAQPYATTLGHLSPALREQLGIAAHDLTALPRAHGEARMRLQGALSEWFLDVAREHTIVLVSDDIHDCDPWTVGWLAALGRAGRHHRLLIVAAQRTDSPASAHIEGLRNHATVLPIGALEATEIAAIVQSVFGDVQHVARVAELVCQRAEGNPGRALDLVKHLVQQGLVTYAECAWILPTMMPEAQLPRDPEELLAARLRRLDEPSRALGRALSVCEGSIGFELSTALAETSPTATYAALEGLIRVGVIGGSNEGYRFTNEALRKLLLRELDDERKSRVHRICGNALLSQPMLTELQRLQAGVQLLRGGDIERGTLEVAHAAKHYGLVDLADVGPAAPSLASALELFIAHGRPAHEQLTLYAPLALAGYYAERVYFDRYAERTIALMQQLLGLNRARKLRRFLGAKLGLLISLGLSALRFRRFRDNPRVPTFREAIMLLFNCVACSTGVCTVCIDSKRAQYFADVLEPMRALGANHIATLMHDFCINLATTIQDRVDLARTRWQAMIERLDSGQPIADLSDDVRILYLAGALYACGVMECWRDTSKALQFAQRLEDFKLKLYELTANQIRMLYYAHQGNFELAERYRERVEVHAIQRGTAWQAETWTFSAMISVHLRTNNAIGMKHCTAQLRRLSAEIPSLHAYLDLSHGVYLLLRGSPEQALPYLVNNDEPLASAGWGRALGAHARALNSIGEHNAAREICLRALRYLTPG